MFITMFSVMWLCFIAHSLSLWTESHLFTYIFTAEKESGVQWSVAIGEDYRNGERLVLKHSKVMLSLNRAALSLHSCLLTLTNQFEGCTFLANKVFSWKLFLHIAATLARRRYTHPCLKLASQTCYGKTCQGLKFLSRDGHKRTDFMETVKGLSKIIL